MGMGMETGSCTQMVDWNMEVENEMKMDLAHSRISAEMSMPSEMGMTKCGYAYNADTALRARGEGEGGGDVAAAPPGASR
jgi:hypothetical protein